MATSRRYRTADGVARVTRMAGEFVAYVGRLELATGRRHAAVMSHLQEAAASVLANLGEAFGELSRGDKRRFFRYALRSAGECEHLLRGLQQAGGIGHDRFHEGIRRLRDIRMDLLRLIRWVS